MKKLLLLFICLLAMGISSASAAEKTFTATVMGATGTLQNSNTVTFATSTLNYNTTTYLTNVSFPNNGDGVACPIELAPGKGNNTNNSPSYNKEGSLRMYPNNVLTINAIGDCKITKLVFTLANVSKYATPTVSEGSGEADKTTSPTKYTWTAPATGAVASVTVTANSGSGKQFCFTEIAITYEDGEGGGDEPTALTLSGKYGENAIADGAVVTVDKGSEFTFTASEAALFTLNDEALNTEAATSATWTANEECADKEMTLTATAGEKTASFSFTLTVKEPDDPKPSTGWELVTSETLLEDGDVVTFTAKEYTGKASDSNVTYPALLMKALSSNDVITCQEYKYEDFKFDVTPYAITLHKAGDNWTMTTSDGAYLSANTKNKVKTEATVSGNSTFTIRVKSDGAATVESQGTTKRKLRYNANIANPVDIATARFAFYENSTQQDVYMYRQIKAVEPEAPEAPVYLYDEASKIVELTCKDGHKLWVAEEDASEEESETPAQVNSYLPMAAEAGSDHLWVEANNGDTSHKIYITTLTADKLVFAKAVHNESGNESDVLFIRIKPDGTISGVEGVAIDAAAGEDVYYDLQGRRVAAPVAGGFYVRVNGGKAEKVVIR